MTIPIEHKMERLSTAYVGAVAAHAGMILIPSDKSSDYGTDFVLQKARKLQTGKIKGSGPQINLQVKSSSGCFIRANNVVYDMASDDYNKLVDELEDDVNTFLILFRTPAISALDRWLSLDDDQLIIRHCCYWQRLSGPLTDNKQSIRIEIPLSQILTPKALLGLFDLV
jgi:hypothetical protein